MAANALLKERALGYLSELGSQFTHSSISSGHLISQMTDLKQQMARKETVIGRHSRQQ